MLILASQSPRRRELLGRITEQFIVRPTGCDESFTCADPAEHARQLALRKCAAAVTESAPEDAVIAADTVVFLDGVLLEKPGSEAEAKAIFFNITKFLKNFRPLCISIFSKRRFYECNFSRSQNLTSLNFLSQWSKICSVSLVKSSKVT